MSFLLSIKEYFPENINTTTDQLDGRIKEVNDRAWNNRYFKDKTNILDLARKKVNIIGAIVGSIAFTSAQFFIRKAELTNLEDFFKLFVTLIIFFTVWVISQSILFKISENKANEDIE